MSNRGRCAVCNVRRAMLSSPILSGATYMTILLDSVQRSSNETPTMLMSNAIDINLREHLAYSRPSVMNEAYALANNKVTPCLFQHK